MLSQFVSNDTYCYRYRKRHLFINSDCFDHFVQFFQFCILFYKNNYFILWKQIAIMINDSLLISVNNKTFFE